MFTIHQKQFSFHKIKFDSLFTNGANRPGVNCPVRKMLLKRIIPEGTGFGANRPVTLHCLQFCVHVFMLLFISMVNLFSFFFLQILGEITANF